MNISKEIDVIINNFQNLKKSETEIQKIAEACIKSIKSGGKIMFCGNGGSAADAQHIAAELVVKYKKIRKGIPAIALTTDSSILTAIGNDLSAESIFERQIEALGNKEDVLISISTSGNSKNIINAIKTAKEKGIKTILLTGANGGEGKNFADILLKVPSEITNNIQEMHIACAHMICAIIEENL